jgi:hypothetical protein
MFLISPSLTIRPRCLNFDVLERDAASTTEVKSVVFMEPPLVSHRGGYDFVSGRHRDRFCVKRTISNTSILLVRMSSWVIASLFSSAG